MLSEDERLRLAHIERTLSREDPGLAQALAVPLVPARQTRTAWAAALGLLAVLAGLVGLGSLPALVGVALITAAVLPDPPAPRLRRRPNETSR